MKVAFITIFVFFLFIFFSFISYTSKAQINIKDGETAQILAQKLAGQGITISNATLNCASQANGIFTVISSNLGLDSGIILTNGRAATQGSLIGLDGNYTQFASNNNNMPGDTMLDVLAGSSTLDACSLEFDVYPHGDTLKFNYVFSSEEYKNAVCGNYNDAFAFFISGPGIIGSENIALVPGTTIPVTINSINDGIPGLSYNLSKCTAMGVGSPFTMYYIDNSSGQTLTHHGFTNVLQAVHAVSPCYTYHLKLAIADAGDPLYDSGVFLEAGSLKTTSFGINAIPIMIHDTSTLLCIKECLPGKFVVRRSQINAQPQTIKFIIAGDAVNGVDYSFIPDSIVIPAYDTTTEIIINGLPTPPFGTKKVQLFILSPSICSSSGNIIDSASLSIYDTLHVKILTQDTLICDNQNVQVHVLGDDYLTYSWIPATGLSNDSIKDPIIYPNNNISYTVTAVFAGTPCPAVKDWFSIGLKPAPKILIRSDSIVCYHTSFTLNATIVGNNLNYTYYWTGPDSFFSTQYYPTITDAQAINEGTYNLHVTNDSNSCTTISGIGIYVFIPDTPTINSPFIACQNANPIPLQAIGKQLQWYTNQYSSPTNEAPTPPTNVIASYTYYVTQTLGDCESPKATFEVDIKKCCDGNILIPNAFSPNSDGKNDKFELITDYGYTIEKCTIYNRWGHLVYDNNEAQWDGIFNGQQAEVGTYFYYIKINCILGGSLVRKGDITLIR